MNDFDDLLGDALASRAADTPGAAPDASHAIGRARHHRARRRMVAVSCVGVLALGGVAGLMLRAPSSEPTSVADAPGAEAPRDTTCPSGQVLSSEGDVLLHEGRPYAVIPGQCITATEQESTITGCEVTVSSATGEVTSGAGVVTADGDTGCVLLGSADCPPPPDPGDGTIAPTLTVTTIVTSERGVASDMPVPVLTCAFSCGGFSAFPGPAMTPEGPAMTAFVDADSDGAFDDPPNVVVEACPAPGAPVPILGAVPTTTSVEP